MASALRAARRVLVAQRRSEFCCYTPAPHRNTKATYDAMDAAERAAILRYDVVIAKIDEALR